ncbi:hypothetical protein EC844_12948 [Acinetobacter calcoaceticus]|uniref:Lysozyme inhibitor LprI N-terminal domain-containing protein n=1 Tax=Acinetobacter calcoaceticus TaxID=471 RepID=A0A4R1XI17_ACICA|nr:hypothetical protein EC844_12948 [Acinetobacter calcoaceticus]
MNLVNMKLFKLGLFNIASLLLISLLSNAAMAKAKSSSLPNDSYIHAKFQPSYAKCIANSYGITPEIQICDEQEYAYHKQRVQQSYAKILTLPDSVNKDKVMDEIANWWSDTEKYCTWDPETEGQGQMLDAQSCSLNRVANLADKLKKY